MGKLISMIFCAFVILSQAEAQTLKAPKLRPAKASQTTSLKAPTLKAPKLKPVVVAKPTSLKAPLLKPSISKKQLIERKIASVDKVKIHQPKFKRNKPSLPKEYGQL